MLKKLEHMQNREILIWPLQLIIEIKELVIKRFLI